MDEQSRQYGQENFSLPHDVVPLPSQGLFYKNKKKSIKVGYLTASDENIIMGGAEDFIYQLIRNKVYEPDIKLDDLLECDVEAILIFLRNSSFGPEIVLNITDPKTSKPFKTTIMLDQLPLNKGVDPNTDGTYSVTLPKTNATIKLKPLTYGESREILKIIDSFPAGRVAPRVTLRLQKQIVEVNGNSDKGQISTFVEQLPISDSKFIKKFLEENIPRIDLDKIVTSPSGEKLTVNVGFGADFFRPFIGL